nr:DDE-type integrase/transposase/recombinase [Enterococcus hulanensis]
MNRQFEQSQIDAVWVTDITYIYCSDGRLYLSNYTDLTTRIPRCCVVDSRMKKEIVVQPLEIYKGELPRVIHSDRGSKYRSFTYQELLTDYHITHSMSQSGTPVDNSVVESFHRSIKRKLIEPNKHKSKI